MYAEQAWEGNYLAQWPQEGRWRREKVRADAPTEVEKRLLERRLRNAEAGWRQAEAELVELRARLALEGTEAGTGWADTVLSVRDLRSVAGRHGHGMALLGLGLAAGLSLLALLLGKAVGRVIVAPDFALGILVACLLLGISVSLDARSR